MFANAISLFPIDWLIGASGVVDHHGPITESEHMTSSQRIALVTGGNKGIGLEIARQLGKAGVTVFIGARDAGRGEAAVRTLQQGGVHARSIALDVTDDKSVAEAAQEIEAQACALDILINNAGIGEADDGRPSLAALTAVRHVMETNFLGALRVTQAMLPLLRRSPSGRIVNLSSSLGSLTMNGDPASPYYQAQLIGYNASKAALNMLTVQLAHELADSPIRVNSACPGFVSTDLNGHTGRLTVEDGAATPVRLALMPEPPSGAFIDAKGPVPW